VTQETTATAAAPDISICIANYNGEDILAACLASVYTQETRARFEVIVHDDASTDGAVDAVREQFPEVQFLLSEQNVGYCVSNQRLAEAARGEYLLLLNNDVELLPGALEVLYQSILAGHDSIRSLTEYTMDGDLSCRGMGMDLFFTPFQCRERSHKVAFAMGACLLLRRQLWLELGGYPAFFEYTCEDFYLCLQARARGVPVEILGESGYRHHMGKSINPDGINLGRRRISERNRLYIINEVLPWRDRLVVWPLFQLMYWLEMAGHAVASRSLAPLRALEKLDHEEERRIPVLSLLTWRASKVLYAVGRAGSPSG
jgi:GT2 family glycosyltransferase